MKDTQLFSVSEMNGRRCKVEIIDLTLSENLKKKFSFWRIVSDRDIDQQFGRNRLLCFLRIIGVLTVQNRPNPDSRYIKYFSEYNPSGRTSRKVHGSSYKLFITGEGIREIRLAIEGVRLSGGSL